MENFVVSIKREDVYRHLIELCQNDVLFTISVYGKDMQEDDLERIVISDGQLRDKTNNWRGTVIGTVRLLPANGKTTVMFVNKDAFWDEPIPESGKLLFSQFIQRVREHFDTLKLLEAESDSTQTVHTSGKDAFIVHGHDETVKERVARYIEKLGLNAIILHEQPNAGRTIIEKFETYSNVGFAVILLTPDDVGASRQATSNNQLRARQNVIFELGYFIGKLGRNRVCALYKQEIELPSDIDGLLYLPLDNSGAWKLSLAKEIKHAGIPIDLDNAL